MFADRRGPGDLDFVTWTPGRDRTDLRAAVIDAYRRLSAALTERGAVIIQERIFGRTEAAAATAVLVALNSSGSSTPKPIIFKADHPFIFFIQHKESGQILFMGKVENPNS